MLAFLYGKHLIASLLVPPDEKGSFFVCYDADAHPPVTGPPITAATTGPTTLTSGDGTVFAAYAADPGEVSGASVLLLPDNRGLSGFYEELAGRLAEQGHPTLAIDYFGRTAGADHRDRGPEFAELTNLMPNHLAKLTRDGLCADIDAALARLDGPVVALGFCMGGRFAFQTADPRFGLAGAIGLYGFPGELNGASGPIQLAPRLTAPILALWGGADEGIPAGLVAEFDKALTAAGSPHEFVTYPGAPHGFFELGRAEHAEICADAWARILGFLAGVRR